MSTFMVWCATCQKAIPRDTLRDSKWAVHLHKEAEGHDAVIYRRWVDVDELPSQERTIKAEVRQGTRLVLQRQGGLRGVLAKVDA